HRWVDKQISSQMDDHLKKSSDSTDGQSRSRTTNSGFVSSREGNTTSTHPSTTTCGSSTKMGPTSEAIPTRKDSATGETSAELTRMKTTIADKMKRMEKKERR